MWSLVITLGEGGSPTSLSVEPVSSQLCTDGFGCASLIMIHVFTGLRRILCFLKQSHVASHGVPHKLAHCADVNYMNESIIVENDFNDFVWFAQAPPRLGPLPLLFLRTAFASFAGIYILPGHFSIFRRVEIGAALITPRRTATRPKVCARAVNDPMSRALCCSFPLCSETWQARSRLASALVSGPAALPSRAGYRGPHAAGRAVPPGE
jgi:hypothetical protein